MARHDSFGHRRRTRQVELASEPGATASFPTADNTAVGVFVPKPRLEAGERILIRRGANPGQGHDATGGRLFIMGQVR